MLLCLFFLLKKSFVLNCRSGDFCMIYEPHVMHAILFLYIYLLYALCYLADSPAWCVVHGCFLKLLYCVLLLMCCWPGALSQKTFFDCCLFFFHSWTRYFPQTLSIQKKENPIIFYLLVCCSLFVGHCTLELPICRLLLFSLLLFVPREFLSYSGFWFMFSYQD